MLAGWARSGRGTGPQGEAIQLEQKEAPSRGAVALSAYDLFDTMMHDNDLCRLGLLDYLISLTFPPITARANRQQYLIPAVTNHGEGTRTTILGPRLGPSSDTSKVQSPSDHLVPHTRQILRPPTSNQHHTVFLQIMPFSRYIRNRRLARRELDSAYFSDGRIGLFGLGGVDFGNDAFLLEAVLKQERGGICWAGFTGASQYYK